MKVTRIGSGAFSNCKGLNEVTIPESVTTIGGRAFSHCIKLTSLTMPEGVTTIGQYAFANSSGMKCITFPNSLTKIGYQLFDMTYGIETVVSKILNPSDIAYDVFNEDMLKNATLYVPTGTIDAYRLKKEWKKFVHIVEGLPASVTTLKNEEGKESKRYALDGRTVKAPHKGIQIIKTNNGSIRKVIDNY